jgi:rhodanese-related sulfurtransferase
MSATLELRENQEGNGNPVVPEPASAKASIKVRELCSCLEEAGEAGQKGVMIDVRTPAEYHEMHVAGSALMPLDELDVETVRGACKRGEPLYVMCYSGKRAAQAVKKLSGAGLENCVLVEGGIQAWDEAGLPVVRGERKVIPLERQVRIAAGLLVLTGVTLGWLVHPGWFGLAGFVGAGLVFAGITDTCGMGMMIAKMPWNKRGAQPQACRLESRS